MAKRHPAFIPVARDHHDGLLLALRLQQGEQALPRLWSYDTTWQAREVIRFHREHLTGHFRVEEEKIFPLAAQKIKTAGPVISELLQQHRTIGKAAEAMTGRESDVTRDELISFGKELESHIRSEDRVLFPLMEKELAPALLSQLEKDVQDYYPQ